MNLLKYTTRLTLLTSLIGSFCFANPPPKKYDLNPDIHPQIHPNEDPFKNDQLKLNLEANSKLNIQLQVSFSQLNPKGTIPILQNDSYNIESEASSIPAYNFQGTHWLNNKTELLSDHGQSSDENQIGLFVGISLAKKNLTLSTVNGYHMNNVELQWLSTRTGVTILKKINPEHLWLGLDSFITADSWQQTSLNTNQKWSTWNYNFGVSGHLDFTVTNYFLCFVGLDHYWNLQGNYIQLNETRPRIGFEWEF